jgi:hypothetical protein
MNDERFVRDLGFMPDTPEAAIAIAARDSLADLADVSPELITSSTTFEWYCAQRDMYESIDFLDFAFQLERMLERLDIRLPKRKDLETANKSVGGDLAQFIRGIVKANTDMARL